MRCGCKDVFADFMITQYLKFVEMCAVSTEEFSPPLHIDLMWYTDTNTNAFFAEFNISLRHTHMIHTRSYMMDLSSHFAEPLDHGIA